MAIKATIIATCILTVFLVAAVPAQSFHGNEPTGGCSGSTTFGEPEPARCWFQHPTCRNTCTWPDVHVRVWVDEGYEGALTPVVTGAVHGNEIVCREVGDSCQGTYEFTYSYGHEVQCDGYGPEDGELFAITEVVNAAWAVHMECWMEGYGP